MPGPPRGVPHQGPARAAPAMRSQHHQLHDLAPVTAVNARLQRELHRADQRLTFEGGEQNPAASAHRLVWVDTWMW